MSHYCKQHPKYSAKREPNALCGDCYQLWFYRNPELKESTLASLQQVYAEAEAIHSHVPKEASRDTTRRG